MFRYWKYKRFGLGEENKYSPHEIRGFQRSEVADVGLLSYKTVWTCR
jgi:hypothetical protein